MQNPGCRYPIVRLPDSEIEDRTQEPTITICTIKWKQNGAITQYMISMEIRHSRTRAAAATIIENMK